MTEQEFRSELDRITTDRNSALWWPDIQNLGLRYPHSISLVDVNANRGLNCFAFALGLGLSPAYLEIASHSTNPNVFADTAFVRFLLKTQTLSPCPGADGLIIYFNEDEPRHGGLLRSGRVTSKWGTGDWYEHAVYELPAQHGSEIKTYGPPMLADIERAFLSFAEQSGARIDYLLARCRRRLTSV